MDNFPGTPHQPPDHVLSAQSAEELFQPYKLMLAECIQRGWDAWKTDYEFKHHILRPRTRANIVYDEIVFHVGQMFAGLPEVEFKPFRTSFLLYIGKHIVVRFKKFGRDGRCSNIKTHQQFLFRLQLELPGMESGTMFQAGYALDDLQQEIVRKAIVCEFGNRVLYMIVLGDANAALEFQAPPIPELPKKGRFEAAIPELEKKKKNKRKGE